MSDTYCDSCIEAAQAEGAIDVAQVEALLVIAGRDLPDHECENTDRIWFCHCDGHGAK